MIGKTIKNYRILEELGHGNLGIVYLAEHKALGLKYTVKVLYPHLAKNDIYKERFVKIAQAQAMLKHPNIVEVLDFIEQDGQSFVISEYIDGPSLEKYLQSEKKGISYNKILKIIEGPLNALNYIHSKGIIHRNIKPSNIILDSTMNGYITDFGSAIVLGDRTTQQGAVVSTAFYISPEMSSNPKNADHRSDIYSIGCVLYEIATGKPPYEGETDYEILQKHINDPIPPIDIYNESLPKKFIFVVNKALEKKPDDRFSGCGDMLQALKGESFKNYSVKKVKKVSSTKIHPESERVDKIRKEPIQADSTPKAINPIIVIKRQNKSVIISGLIIFVILIFLLFKIINNSLTTTSGDMVEIQSGCFEMGPNKGGGDHDEYPRHSVCILKFKIDKYEVTNEKYIKCVEAGVCAPPNVKSSNTRKLYYGNNQFKNYPVLYVSWEDAKKYCEWAGKRLPTEAEWEFASRGGDKSQVFPWGNHADQLKANYNSNDTVETGSYSPNNYGLYDMSGNVWEWVDDWYDANYYKDSPSSDPKGPSHGIDKVVRGGSWYGESINIRVANRLKFPPDIKSHLIGFRCAK